MNGHSLERLSMFSSTMLLNAMKDARMHEIKIIVDMERGREEASAELQ